MSPNFALFLSQETLRLLMRVDGGWAELGQVDTRAPDMAQRLSDLRDQAQSRAPLGMATKLVIPNDYIRYMTLPPGQTRADVMTALEGATPYEVSELVVDHDTDASGTHVAAVTRDFLEEAERFALDHGLSPVSFVAVPREGAFDREVFFGKTRGADRLMPGGAELGPESEPMTIVALPDELPAPVVSFASKRTAAQPQAPAPEPAKDNIPNTPAPAAKPAPATPVPAAPAQAAKPRPVDPAATPATPKIPLPARASAPAPHRTAATTARPNMAGSPAIPRPQVQAQAAQPQAKASSQKLVRSISKAVDTAPASKPVKPEPAAVFSSRARPKPRDAKPTRAPRLAPVAASTKPVFAHRSADGALKPGAAAATPEPRPSAPALGALSRVGGTRLAQIALGTVFAALMLAGGWLVLRQGAQTDPLPAEIASVETVAPAQPTPVVQTVPEPQPEPEPQPDPAPISEPAEIAGLSQVPVNPTILSEDEARRIYAATGVWQKSPGLPTRPRTAQLDFTRPDGLPPVTRASVPAITSNPEVLRSDQSPLRPAPPPPPGQRFILDENGFVAATAQGALTPGGVLAFAGSPALRPPTRPGTPAPEPQLQEQPGAPTTDGTSTARVTPPTRPGTAPQPPATQPTAPQPELGAEGIRIFAARPDLIPPTRPGTATPPATPTPPAATGTDTGTGADTGTGTRPAVLPPSRGAALAQPEITPGGVSLAGLQSRPALRPDDLKPTPEELDEQAAPADPPSPYAVATSLRPNKRPRNIATIVASASRAPEPRSSAPAVAQPLRPSGTTAQTVAARATEENAIRLSQINLIGVYGSQRSRRALVRLANGRFVKVAIGDQLDGGRVAAIGADSLQYNKGGSRVTLRIPAG